MVSEMSMCNVLFVLHMYSKGVFCMFTIAVREKFHLLKL